MPSDVRATSLGGGNRQMLRTLYFRGGLLVIIETSR